MMGPITAFFTALVSSAVLSRPKLPELEPEPKPEELLTYIAELKEKLRICEAARDAARAERDQIGAQLLSVRSAHHGLLRMFADEQAMRLQLERDIIEMGARAARIDSKRSQEPRHLPLPPAPLTEGQAETLRADGLRFLRQGLGASPVQSINAMNAQTTEALRSSMEQIMRDMEGFVCNCAPGRHELLVGGAMLGRRIFGE